MKKLTYTAPEISTLIVSAADVITASKGFVDAEGVIELAAYGFGGDFGGFNE